MLFLFSFQLQQQQNLLVDQGPKRFMDRAPAFRHPVEDQDSIGIFFCAFLLPRSHHESGDGEWLRDARWGCIWRACRWPLRPSALSLRGQADTLAACYVRCHSGRKYKGRCVLICMHERSLHFRPDWCILVCRRHCSVSFSFVRGGGILLLFSHWVVPPPAEIKFILVQPPAPLLYIGWLGVGCQRHCKTCRSLLETRQPGCRFFFLAAGHIWWSSSCEVNNLYSKTPKKRLHRTPIACVWKRPHRKLK